MGTHEYSVPLPNNSLPAYRLLLGGRFRGSARPGGGDVPGQHRGGHLWVHGPRAVPRKGGAAERLVRARGDDAVHAVGTATRRLSPGTQTAIDLRIQYQAARAGVKIVASELVCSFSSGFSFFSRNDLMRRAQDIVRHGKKI